MNKIHKGDHVIVRIDKDKGKQGIVLAVFVEHVMAEDVGVAKKHVRPSPMLGTTGDVVNKIVSTHVPNAALVDANGRPSRASIKVGGGMKTCILKTTGVAVGT